MRENLVLGFPTRSDTNRAVQSERSLKVWIQVEEEVYYPSSENKGTDQLCSYWTADLHLCFRICKSVGFFHEAAHLLQF